MLRLLVVSALLLIVPHPAHAGCLESCKTDCIENQYLDQATCSAQCAPKCVGSKAGGKSSAPHKRQYGAVAISKSTFDYGISYHYPNQSGAETEAMERCQLNGATDCRVEYWFYDSCAALAIERWTADTKGAWGGDSGRDKEQAEEKALRNCQRYGTGDCTIVESFCSK